MTLTSKQCIPCQGGIPPLSEAACQPLLQQVPHWKLEHEQNKPVAITRHFDFKNFRAAQSFINQVGDVAEEQNHHPDITFGWGYANIRIQTHKINGLHENDFILAAKINALVG